MTPYSVFWVEVRFFIVQIRFSKVSFYYLARYKEIMVLRGEEGRCFAVRQGIAYSGASFLTLLDRIFRI